MANPGRNREQWLRAAAQAMKPWVKSAARETEVKAEWPDKTLIGVGFTPSRKKGVEAIGSCFSDKAHKDKITRTIFICPTQDDPIIVLATLLHEMVHASLPFDVGHKKPFKQMVTELGLAGKATATYAEEGSELHTELLALSKKLGPYPHVAITRSPVGEKDADGKTKGQSKWIRFYSPKIEGYSAVVSAKMVDEYGRPRDPEGNEMEEKES